MEGHTGREAALRHRADRWRAAGFAGLWESWRDPEGEVFRTFTIATTAANADMAQPHDRMPLTLPGQSG